MRPSRSPRSITVSAVITFVSDAIGLRMAAPRAASTRPDEASIATNEGASTFVGAATLCDAGTAGPGTATTTRASASRAPRSRLIGPIVTAGVERIRDSSISLVPGRLLLGGGAERVRPEKRRERIGTGDAHVEPVRREPRLAAAVGVPVGDQHLR